MKKLILNCSLLLLSNIASASDSISAPDFIQCFVHQANNVIFDYVREGGSNAVRICDELDPRSIIRLYDSLTFIDADGTHKFSNIQSLKLEDVSYRFFDQVDCHEYKRPNDTDSLIGSIINSKTYSRRRNLIEDTLSRMTESPFFSISRKTIGELNFPGCVQ